MTSERVIQEIDILLVEDDAGDVVLTTEALSGSKLTNNLHVADNGELAMKFLRREPPYEDAPHSPGSHGIRKVSMIRV